MGLSKSNPPTAQVKLLVKPSSGRIPWSLFSWLALGSGIVLLGAVILSGARLIVDPYSPNWLKRAFPGLVTGLETAPQTVDDIQAELDAKDLAAASPIAWPNENQPEAWFYPILQADGRSIQELWVYETQGDKLQRVDQVTIRPLKESFITTPLVGTASQVASVESDAPFATVKPMAGDSKERPWLLLEGQRRYGNTVMRYGQILNYQPSSHRLHQLLKWSSSAATPLQWHGAETTKHLVVDQTVGLRPNLLLYQLVPNEPPQLKEVSLYRSIYDGERQLYDKALKLAQGGVWSYSLQMMLSAKEKLEQQWSPVAEQQLQLIRLHAERTEAQTRQTWSSQQQHILTYLIDGQWAQALQVLEQNPDIYPGTLKHLERDFEALWRQITVHLQVYPKDELAQIWGALLVTARQSPEAGENWLTKKTQSKKTLERLRAVGRRDTIVAETLAQAVAPQSNETTEPSNPGRYTSLVGQATAVTSPGNGWLRSQTLPTLVPGQTWYHIHVDQLQTSQGWSSPPSTTTAANFWADSLSLRRQLQLFQNNQPIAGLTIQGVKKNGPSLTLLAIGPNSQKTSLVSTHSKFQWLTTLPWQPVPTLRLDPLTQLLDGSGATGNIADGGLINEGLINEGVTGDDTTGDALIDDGNAPFPTQPSAYETLMAGTIGNYWELTPQQLTELSPYLSYTGLDLTGNSDTEHIFAISDNSPPELKLVPGQTLIFSSTGSILYSDELQPNSLVGFTPKSVEQPASLLVDRNGRYDLIRL